MADGVGDGETAAEAARWATLSVRRWFQHRLARDEPSGPVRFVGELLGEVDRDVAKRASGAAGFRVSLAVALVPTGVRPGGEVAAVVGRIGATTGWVVRPSGPEPVFPARSTDPMPQGGAQQVRPVAVRDGEVLAVTSCGLAGRAQPEQALPYLSSAWAVPPSPLRFLETVAVRREDRVADRAAAVAWVGHFEPR
ncbi:protein phosphatase 2C-like protein [Actinokineospora auranticolor]|uniref:Protein phosphatase 2C-like protein n=1 Tax=Actinokineospora auranticolor TaxID=155976 RepID=A0A2S6GP88_9PSEU|nr:protein phosphatase 2C-like protein [Actinokineospora auranticolor]